MDLVVNGVSLKTLGVITENRTVITKPKRRSNIISVEGIDGSMVEDYGYEAFTLTYKLTLTENEHMDQIYSLLDGDVILEPEDLQGYYYKAKVISDVSYSPFSTWQKSTIEFYIYDPFRYKKDEVDITLSTFPEIINYEGNVNGYPLIKITGSGTVNITFNGVSFSYNFDTPFVFIDCMPGKQNAYYGDVLKNRRMIGEFPHLNTGGNELLVSGSVSQIQISKRSRWI